VPWCEGLEGWWRQGRLREFSSSMS
jgi:hypothetical protein